MTTASGATLGAATSIDLGRPRLLYLTLMLGHMAQGIAFTAFVAALPQMAHDLGPRGAFVAQMTMALAALGIMLGALVSGAIMEKAGTRLTMLGSIVALGIAGSSALLSHGSALLLASRFIVGFATACMVTTCVWGIAAEYHGARRAQAIGMAAALGSGTSLVCTLLGGYLAQRGGWSLAFAQYPAFAALALLLSAVSLRQVRPKRETIGVAPLPYILGLLPLYMLGAILFAVMFMGSTQFAFILEEDGIGNPSTRSLIMSSITVVSVGVSAIYGMLQQRLGVAGTFIVGLIAMSVGLAAIGRGTGSAYAVLGAGLMGVYVGLVVPFVYHEVTERTELSVRSRAIGLLSAFCFFGAFLNPLVFASLGRLIGLRGVFLAVAVAMAGLALATAARLLRRRAAAAPAGG